METGNNLKDMRKRFTCEQCDYKSTSEDAMKTHIKLMHQKIQTTQKKNNSKRINCEQCDKRFNKQETYNNHKHKVHEAKYQCDKCDQKFKTKPNLKDHIKMHNDKTS